MNNLTTTPQRSMMLLEQKEHITKDQHYKMLEACTKVYEQKIEQRGKATVQDTFIYERDYFMLLTLWNVGARISDICDMKSDYIDTYNKDMTYFVNKLSKKDEFKNVINPVFHKVFLEDQYILAYHNFIKKWNISGYLFTNLKQHDKPITEQRPLTTRHANKIVHDYADVAGFNVHPHMYRHGIAVEMLNQQVPIEIISKFLGHRRVETTIQFYAKINSETVRRFVSDKMRIN